MSSRKQALLLWLQAVTESQIQQINDIRNGQLLQKLLSRVQGFSFSSTMGEKVQWRSWYNKIKQIYEQLCLFLQKGSKLSLPSQLTIMNLVEMSKGQSEEGLQTLLYLTFIVCISSSIKSEIVPCIMHFPESAQEELMMIIKECTYEKECDSERENEINEYKQAISRLQFAYNNLAVENESLRSSLLEDEDRVNRNEELLRKVQKQNEELNRELLQKSDLLQRQREELLNDKYGTINEQLVEELKKQLLQRQQSYGQQIFNLKETIHVLRGDLADTRKANSDLLDEQSKRSIMQAREDHSNCVSVEKHKAKLNEILALSKEATQKEMAVKLDNIKLKNVNAELEAKIKKLNEEIHKKNNEFMINRDDAGKLKVEFFSRIRDKLKEKLEEFRLKDNNPNSAADIFDSDTSETTNHH